MWTLEKPPQKGQCIREENSARQKLIQDFLNFHKVEYPTRIAHTATAVQKETSWNKAQELGVPQTDDIECSNFVSGNGINKGPKQSETKI